MATNRDHYDATISSDSRREVSAEGDSETAINSIRGDARYNYPSVPYEEFDQFHLSDDAAPERRPRPTRCDDASPRRNAAAARRDIIHVTFGSHDTTLVVFPADHFFTNFSCLPTDSTNLD